MIAAAVPDGYRLVDWDRRCAGASQYVLDWYTLDDIAADARALLAGLDIERSVVIGSSMGGMVAQQYVLDYPEHTRALALLNTGPDLMLRTGWGKSMTSQAERARSEGDEAVFNGERLRNPPALPARAQLPEPRRKAMLAAREAYLARVAETSDQELLRLASGATRNYAAFAGYDFRPRLGEIDVPTFVLHGTADTTVPWECAEVLEAGIRDAVLHPIPGAEHGILQQPAARDALRAWLEELLPGLG
jgi:pimeloyl-ACP methyl ester carboxylesterase